MHVFTKAATVASVASVIALGAIPAPRAEAQGYAASIERVQYRRGFHRGWRYRHGRYHRGPGWIGPAIGAGIAALIIGGSIAEARSSYPDRWERCEAEFRSFDPSDGTYQPYGGGPRELCPYLRS
jgi:hypothetical protein